MMTMTSTMKDAFGTLCVSKTHFGRCFGSFETNQYDDNDHDFGSPEGFFRITLGFLDLPLCWKLGLIHQLALILMIIHDDDSENDLDNEDAFGSLCVTDLSWEAPS